MTPVEFLGEATNGLMAHGALTGFGPERCFEVEFLHTQLSPFGFFASLSVAVCLSASVTGRFRRYAVLLSAAEGTRYGWFASRQIHHSLSLELGFIDLIRLFFAPQLACDKPFLWLEVNP